MCKSEAGGEWMSAYKKEGDLFSGINTVKDAENMTDLEKKHAPVLNMPKKVKKGEPFEVTVEVGKHLKHPNTIGHFIQWVELYAGDILLGSVDFVPEFSNPKVTFTVMLKYEYPITAMDRCNLHGVWSSGPISIKVE
jgi:superoxide reductase